MASTTFIMASTNLPHPYGKHVKSLELFFFFRKSFSLLQISYAGMVSPCFTNHSAQNFHFCSRNSADMLVKHDATFPAHNHVLEWGGAIIYKCVGCCLPHIPLANYANTDSICAKIYIINFISKIDNLI